MHASGQHLNPEYAVLQSSVFKDFQAALTLSFRLATLLAEVERGPPYDRHPNAAVQRSRWGEFEGHDSAMEHNDAAQDVSKSVSVISLVGVKPCDDFWAQLFHFVCSHNLFKPECCS